MSTANLKVTPSYHNEAEENENENLGDAIYHLPNQKKRERDWIIKEIVDTEWKYITNLKGKFHFPRLQVRTGIGISGRDGHGRTGMVMDRE